MKRLTVYSSALIIALACFALFPLPGLAQEDSWGLCTRQQPHSPIFPGISPPSPLPLGSTLLNSDYLEKQGSIYTLTGQVHIQRDDRWLEADFALYDSDNERTAASGNVRLSDQSTSLKGESAEFDLSASTGELNQAEYYFHDRRGRGRADKLIIESENLLQLKQSTYTTCDAGDNDWSLYAHSLKLDKTTGFGAASAVLLRFKNVPILFLPYMTFPIDSRRKSGFLLPMFGNSSQSGTFFAAPLYLNLAPQYDATITPRNFSRRGLQIQTESRFLTEHQRGFLNLEYLGQDRRRNNDTRYSAVYKQQGRLNSNWGLDIDFNYVSDSDYLRDFGNTLTSTTEGFLEQHAELIGRLPNGTLITRLQGYQTLDKNLPPESRPYYRLPQVLLDLQYPWLQQRLVTAFRSEFVRFEQQQRLSGNRVDFSPAVSFPYRRSWGYATPQLTLRHTRYWLENDGANNDGARSRTLPIFNIDSGLIFERDLSIDTKTWLQTLEPRLYYLYVPYRNQEDIPLFDSTLATFHFPQLFQENRYTGADRIGDANQLTYAVTTRVFDHTGTERLRGSIGQIHYFEDHQVELPGERSYTGRSPVAAEARITLTPYWTARASIVRDMENSEMESTSLVMQYRQGQRKVFNAYYRFARDLIAQSDYSLRWPLSLRWHVIGRWDYSHLDRRLLESIGGFEYQSCCWSLRIVQQKHLVGNPVDVHQEDYNRVWMVQLELKGLTSFGDPIDEALAREVLDYRPAVTSGIR